MYPRELRKTQVQDENLGTRPSVPHSLRFGSLQHINLLSAVFAFRDGCFEHPIFPRNLLVGHFDRGRPLLRKVPRGTLPSAKIWALGTSVQEPSRCAL